MLKRDIKNVLIPFDAERLGWSEISESVELANSEGGDSTRYTGTALRTKAAGKTHRVFFKTETIGWRKAKLCLAVYVTKSATLQIFINGSRIEPTINLVSSTNGTTPILNNVCLDVTKQVAAVREAVVELVFSGDAHDFQANIVMDMRAVSGGNELKQACVSQDWNFCHFNNATAVPALSWIFMPLFLILINLEWQYFKGVSAQVGLSALFLSSGAGAITITPKVVRNFFRKRLRRFSAWTRVTKTGRALRMLILLVFAMTLIWDIQIWAALKNRGEYQRTIREYLDGDENLGQLVDAFLLNPKRQEAPILIRQKMHRMRALNTGNLDFGEFIDSEKQKTLSSIMDGGWRGRRAFLSDRSTSDIDYRPAHNARLFSALLLIELDSSQNRETAHFEKTVARFEGTLPTGEKIPTPGSAKYLVFLEEKLHLLFWRLTLQGQSASQKFLELKDKYDDLGELIESDIEGTDGEGKLNYWDYISFGGGAPHFLEGKKELVTAKVRERMEDLKVYAKEFGEEESKVDEPFQSIKTFLDEHGMKISHVHVYQEAIDKIVQVQIRKASVLSAEKSPEAQDRFKEAKNLIVENMNKLLHVRKALAEKGRVTWFRAPDRLTTYSVYLYFANEGFGMKAEAEEQMKALIQMKMSEVILGEVFQAQNKFQNGKVFPSFSKEEGWLSGTIFSSDWTGASLKTKIEESLRRGWRY